MIGLKAPNSQEMPYHPPRASIKGIFFTNINLSNDIQRLGTFFNLREDICNCTHTWTQTFGQFLIFCQLILSFQPKNVREIQIFWHLESIEIHNSTYLGLSLISIFFSFCWYCENYKCCLCQSWRVVHILECLSSSL